MSGPAVVAKEAPGIISQLLGNNPVTQLAGAAKDAVSAVNQGALGNTRTEATGTNVKTGRAETDKDALATRDSLNRFTLDAQEGAKGAALTEERLATPEGKAIKESGNSLIDQATEDNGVAAVSREQALKQSQDNLIKAEQGLKDAAAKATINPNEYLDKMGVGGKVLTSIGLLLSGIGSGITGQPNGAMEVLQRNIDRSIDAQKERFKQQYELAKGSQSLAQSAKERAQVNQVTQQMAAVSVLTGTNAAMQGLQAQISGETALNRWRILSKQMQDQLALNKNALDQNYISSFQSNDIENRNMWNNAAKVAADMFSPEAQKGKGFNAPSPKNKASEMQRGITPPQAPVQEQAPAAQPTQAPKEEVKQSFLDSILSKQNTGIFGG